MLGSMPALLVNLGSASNAATFANQARLDVCLNLGSYLQVTLLLHGSH
jgi:hypothetical protein